MACGERHQFIDQFLIFPLQVNFIDDLADAPHRPQLFGERKCLIVRFACQLDWEVKFMLCAVHHSFHGDLGCATLFVTPNQNELITGEQIVGVSRINPIHQRSAFGREILSVDRYRNVFHGGSANARVELADVSFNIFIGSNVLALSETEARQFVEQPAVHVVPDSKAEYPSVNFISLLGVLRDFCLVAFSSRRQTVSKKYDVVGAAVILKLCKRRI